MWATARPGPQRYCVSSATGVVPRAVEEVQATCRWFSCTAGRAAGACLSWPLLAHRPGDSTARRRPTCLSAPAGRKEDFSLFRVSDEEHKVKISPQLLLATQRFLSRGEGGHGSWPRSPCSPCMGQSAQGRHRRLPFPVGRVVRRPRASPCSPAAATLGAVRGPGWCHLCAPRPVVHVAASRWLVLGRARWQH